jgi:hypothetical protein
MNRIKNLVFAVLLVSALAFNAFAGDVDTPGYVPPPPPRLTVADDDLSTRLPDSGTEEQTGIVTAETSDYLFLEALAAFLSVY